MIQDSAKWIWCTDHEPNCYCHAHGHVHLAAMPVGGSIQIGADGHYQLWVNGRYVGQGPTPSKPPVVFFDTHDISTLLREGDNVIAVLAHHCGIEHCTYTPAPPAILAQVEAVDADGNTACAVSDESWRVRVSKAYARNVPRRTWATGWCEYYDARKEHTGWIEPAYDDSAWEPAQVVAKDGLRLLPRMTAPLEELREDGACLLNVWTTLPGVPAVLTEAQFRESGFKGGLTARLDEEPLTGVMDTANAGRFYSSQAGGWMPIEVEPSENGLAVAVDFGREIAGQLEFDIEAPEGVTVDICPAENLRSGRPWCFRKGGQYARRYITRGGRQQWRGFAYDGLRYVHFVIRGPHPKVTIYRIGVWRRQSSIPIRARFECDDPVVNRIWDITCHTMRIGSQDFHVDCPTREQTSAWGDATWSGLWAGYLTGDYSALRHLVHTLEYVQLPDGQVPSYSFSSLRPGPLFDYSLIAVWANWIYLQHTGDADLASRLLPRFDRVLDWYRRETAPSGLIETDLGAYRRQGKGTLFIDHPGLWHTCPPPHPGLDRNGTNAAINFFFIHALDAHANVLEYLGDTKGAASHRAEANRVRAASERLFYNPSESAYVDGVQDGRQSAQISQQTNALAVTSGACPGDRARSVLERVLNEDDASLCLCGTYFWTYVSMALCMSDMHSEMWSNVVRLWNDMAERGATSWWETFLGDEQDSLSHIWSSVPGYIILAEVLGVKPAELGFRRIAISPRIDLLRTASGVVPLPDGEIGIQWQTSEDGARGLCIDLRADAPADVTVPPGWKIDRSGTCSMQLAPNSRASLRVGQVG